MSASASTQQPRDEIRRILDNRALRLAGKTFEESQEVSVYELLSFPLAEERFAAEVGFVKEVRPLDKQSWSQVPCTPEFIVGVINIRGRIYSIMHVSRFFGQIAEGLSERAHVLLVQGSGGMELCLLADDVPRLEKVPTDRVQPPTATVSPKIQDYVLGVTEGMLTLLNLKYLLSDPAITVNETL